MEAKGGNGFGSLDNQVYVPITTAMAKLTGGRGARRPGRARSWHDLRQGDERERRGQGDQ